jgi:cellulose synthase (UDP-forming)
MSIFFLAGRKVFRNHERSMAAVDCMLTTEDETISCITHDLSEGGISVILDTPKYIPGDIEIGIKLVNDRYSSEFTGKVAHVASIGSRWKYAFTVKEITEQEQRQLLHIIYDREPTLPQKLDKDISTFEDIRLNFVRRGQSEFMSNRKLARIALNRELQTPDHGTVTLLDFNYEFVLVEIEPHDLANEIQLPLGENISLECAWVQSLRDKRGDLYRVTNIRDIARNHQMPTLEALLKQWNKEHIQQGKKGTTSQGKNNFSPDELNEMAYL